jgi:hypothetical protein
MVGGMILPPDTDSQLSLPYLHYLPFLSIKLPKHQQHRALTIDLGILCFGLVDIVFAWQIVHLPDSWTD